MKLSITLSGMNKTVECISGRCLDAFENICSVSIDHSGHEDLKRISIQLTFFQILSYLFDLIYLKLLFGITDDKSRSILSERRNLESW